MLYYGDMFQLMSVVQLLKVSTAADRLQSVLGWQEENYGKPSSFPKIEK